MRTKTLFMILLLLPSLAFGLMAERQEVQRVAGNWVELVLARDGAWGLQPEASALEIQEFKRGDTLLGYYCPVEPAGYMILGLHRELAPVRFYSGSGSLDLTVDQGMTDLLKVRLERLYLGIEASLGSPIEPGTRFAGILEESCEDLWESLSREGFDPNPFRKSRDLRTVGMDYQEGDSLLEDTTWNQDPPYNHYVDWGGCEWAIPDTSEHYNENYWVGCVATAGAMVLHHWNWPPYGAGTPPYSDSYDWANMRDHYYWSNWYMDMRVVEDGVNSAATWPEILAVAELSFEVAEAVGMSYGCDGSSDNTYDLDWALHDFFRMYDSQTIYKDEHTTSEYWNLLKIEFNYNRPVPYRIPGHAIVADGWQEIDTVRYHHIRYGWNGSNDGWHALGEIPSGDLSEEYFLRHMAPATIISSNLDTAYGFDPYFPYRYFCYDTEGIDSDFLPGNRLQVLKGGFHLKNLVGGGEISFFGSPGLETSFFLYGDEVNQTRIKIFDGELKMVNGGELVIY